MVARGLDRIVLLDNHIACTMAGMTADARSLIEPALMACTEHFLTYSEYIPMETLVESVARQATNFGKGGDASSGDSDTDSDSDYDCDSDSDSYDGNTQPPATARPYGVALLFAGVVKGQPQLWHLDPTGDFQHIGAKAIGSGGDSAQLKLLEHYKAAMQLNEAKFLALSILQGIIGQKLTSSNVEVMVVTQEELCHKLRKAELEQEIATLPSNTEGGCSINVT